MKAEYADYISFGASFSVILGTHVVNGILPFIFWLALSKETVILTADMTVAPESKYQPTQGTRTLARMIMGSAFVLALSAIAYSLLLLNELNTKQEEPLQLDPEETVLFYQPEELIDMELSVETPSEDLEYIARMKHLA